jgi:hypothetical protein
MKMHLGILVAVSFFAASAARAQQRPQERPTEEATHPQQQHRQPRANQGRIPPAPSARHEQSVSPEGESRDGRSDTTPHVNNDRWYGHDRPDDKRYHIDHPYPHGRLERFGPAYTYSIARVDRDHHRFWLPGGFFFEVASWDWPISADWCWDCGDDFVVYEDPDHIGWYLLYNTQTGAYVHVSYQGG